MFDNCSKVLDKIYLVGEGLFFWVTLLTIKKTRTIPSVDLVQELTYNIFLPAIFSNILNIIIQTIYPIIRYLLLLIFVILTTVCSLEAVFILAQVRKSWNCREILCVEYFVPFFRKIFHLFEHFLPLKQSTLYLLLRV